MECVLYGIGSSYLAEVLDTLDRLGWTVTAYVSNDARASVPSGLSPIVVPGQIQPAWLHQPVVFPLITPGYRQRLHREALQLGFQSFASVVDPSAVISRRSSLEPGALVNTGVLVGANTHAGRFCVLNRGASVGHDVVLEDFVTLGPGAILCGGCRVRYGAFVGAGAVVNPGVTIGANCIVGAGTVVARDVPDRSVVSGKSGAIAVKQDVRGYNDVEVDP
jgi:sugar O-acyltransferase (sialic acid O-acetyltransferase NeuD family)